MSIGDQVIADGIPTELDDEVPEPVSFDAAIRASEQFRWAHDHPFPTCFVCGPERRVGDGLCIYPGRVPARTIVAAPWVPDTSMCEAEGRVRPEIVWAALDCPSWFGLLEFESGTTVALLGQLSAHVVERPKADEQCVVIGWSAGRDRRKLFGGAAIYTAAGRLLARSAAVWIEPPV